MRLIDADALIKQRRFIVAEAEGMCGDVVWVRDIQGAPTIDAVPVVRCKDCKWYGTDYECENSYSPCFHNGSVNGNWFCADGERSEDEAD